MWITLPFTGAVRFRARRTNDNGDAVDLSDEQSSTLLMRIIIYQS